MWIESEREQKVQEEEGTYDKEKEQEIENLVNFKGRYQW